MTETWRITTKTWADNDKTWADNGKTWADNDKTWADNGKKDRVTLGTWPGHSGNTAGPGGNVARSQLVMSGS